MAQRLERVRCLYAYGAKPQGPLGDLVDRVPGEEYEEDPALARQMIAANWAEPVDPPPRSLTAEEGQKARQEKEKRAAELEAAAGGQPVQAATREPKERAARTERAAGQ